MKTLKILLVGFILFIAISCQSEKDKTNPPNSEQSNITTKYGEPEEYFPMVIGKKWKYNIKLAENKEMSPLQYEVVSWPIGKNAISYLTRGILYSRDKNDDLWLVLQIDSSASKQGPLQFPIGVRLKVLRDDLRIYGWPEYNEGIYWARPASGRFQVTEVVLYDPMGPGAPRIGSWGGWGAEPGYSLGIKFFGGRPNTSISLGKNSPDRLVFIGPEDFAGSTALHFRRLVGEDSENDYGKSKNIKADYLNKSFTEDMWYLRHVGLVRLVQIVDGTRTMVWTLEGH
ncbi:MAG: hypothetical protein WC621_02190 [Patescibacteria group bacterium]